MRLSIVSDEISADLNTALEVLQEYPACREMELRRLGLDALPQADARWLDVAEKAVKNRRLRVTALSASTEDADTPLLDLAARFNCNLLSLTLPDDDSDDPPEALPAFCQRAQERNVTVALRNHPESMAGTLTETLEILEELDLPNLGLDWDPASAMAAGDGTGMDDIDRLTPRLKLLHVRDAVRRGMSADWAPLGKGVIPWEDILELLYAAGYRGPVVLDLGLPNKVREARTALPLVARWLDVCRLRRPDDQEHDDEDTKPRFKKRR